MTLLLYLLIFLIFAIINALLYVQINSQAQSRLQTLKEEEKNLTEEYRKLKAEVEALKKQANNLKTKLTEEKKVEQPTPKSTQKEKPDPINLLKLEGLITNEQLEKAKNYIKKANSNLELIDALVVLGYLDKEKLTWAKNKSQE